MGEADFWAPTPGGVRLHVRLTPKSSRDAIEGVQTLADGRRLLKARVRAAPEEGKANDALRRLVAQALGVPPSAVELVAGSASRIKTLAISGDADALTAKLVKMSK